MSKDDRELIELKPCPFCGENMAVMATWISNASDSAEAMEAPVCPCGAQGPMYPTRRLAANAWNIRAATRLEALQAQPVGEESGWLVEMVEPDNNKSPVPRWWHPEHGWMWDANKALRFAREIDAQDYITGSGRLPGKPTEHIFLDSAGGEA